MPALILVVVAVYTGLVMWLARTGSSSRELAALALAPLAPCLVSAAISRNIESVVTLAPMTYLLTLPAVPLYLLSRKRAWTRSWQFIASSAALGGLFCFLTGHARTALGTLHLYNILVSAGYGATVGLAFWLIALAGMRRNNSLEPRRER
jgi:hypothetical protein